MPAAEATDVMTYEKKEVSSRGSPSSVMASNLDKMAAVCGAGSGASPPFASFTSGHTVEQQNQPATSSAANQVAGNCSPQSMAPDASAPTANRFSMDQQRQHPLGGTTATFIIPAPSVATGNTSRSSISTVDSEGRVGASALRMSKRWTTLETAGRLLLSLSIAFLVAGVVLTAVGFAAATDSTTSPGFLTMKILGPVCLATTAVMWVLGGAFSRLWRSEWRRRQQAMELRARVQLHALAMDLLKKPILSPRIMQDPVLRRQMLVKLRQQSAMDASSETASTRRSSRLVEPPLVSMATPTSAAAARRHRDSVISAILRQEIERRKSLKDVADGAGAEKLTPAAALAAAAAAFELPGIHISRIETMDIEDDDVVGSSRGGGSGRGHNSYYGGGGGGGLGSRRFIIIESDLSSGDFSQLSFTSEYSLNGNGSRSSRSRSSRASSNVSSRLWDFSPRESEWDADVSHGSRESQLSSNAAISKSDWGGGPSYGDCYNSTGGGAESRPPQYLHRGGGRDYSLLSPAMPRKSSVVTFDVGEPGVRRHSSPVPPARRRSIVNSASAAATSATAGSGSANSTAGQGQGSVPASALKYRNVVVSGPSLLASGAGSSSGGSSLAASGSSRFLDDYRTLTQFRKRSAGDQSIISIRIDEDDSGEELEERCQLGIDEEELMLDENDDVNDRRRKTGNCHGRQGRQDMQDDELDEEYDDDEDTDERTPLNGGSDNGGKCGAKAASRSTSNDSHVTRSPEMTPQQQEELLKKRRSSMKRNNTDDSDVARRVERIFDEIDLSVTDSVDESTTRLMTSHDSADTPSGLTIGEGDIGRIDIDTPTRQLYGKIPSCTVTSDTGAHSRTVVFYSPSSSPTTPNCPSTDAKSSNCRGGISDQSKQSVAAVGKGAADTRPTRSSAGRKFHLLSSIPRAIFSLERRTLGGGSGGGSTVGSKKDESQSAGAQSTTTACGGSPASHKPHRLLFRLGIGDDSSGKS